MQKIILTRGLPASGKSTWAKSMVEQNPNEWKRVNKDDLRAMITNSVWTKENEHAVVTARNALICAFLSSGHSVIVDDTNIETKHITDIFHLVSSKFPTVEFEVKEFDVDVNTCIERDKLREKSVGKVVIRTMAKRMENNGVDDLLNKLNQTRYAPNFQSNSVGKHRAIIVDIDGTVARHTTRSPFDWLRVDEDEPKTEVINIISSIVRDTGAKVIFLSGRDSICYNLTKHWLDKNVNFEYELHMRTKNDNRKDYIVKRELFDIYVRHKYNVVGVFDDRDQVVDMWRKQLGLTVFQVDYGNF